MSWQFSKYVSVEAKRKTLWTHVEDIEGPVLVKLEVAAPNATWRYAEDRSCGPDGDLTSLIARSRCLCPGAPVGALIGKLGGSSAGIDDGKIFPVGRYCVVDVPSDSGALFLSINDEVTGMEDNDDTLAVAISQRPKPAASEREQVVAPPADTAKGSARADTP